MSGRDAFLFVALVIGVGTCARPAHGATYHVSPLGNDSFPGTSAAEPWLTIARANSAARPGDVIYVWPNSSGYTDFPNPDSAGSNPTGGGFIRFIGASTVADPIVDMNERLNIRLNGGNLVKPYTVLHGLHLSGGFVIHSSASRCSVSCTTILGDLSLDGCDYTVVSRCLNLGSRLSIAYVGNGGDVVGCTVENCQFPQLGVGVEGGNHRFITGNTRVAKCDSLRFVRNALTTVISDKLDSHPRVHFWTEHSLFAYNVHRIFTSFPDRETYAMRLRDSTFGNRFVGDTIRMSGPAPAIIYFSSDGDSGKEWKQTVGNNLVDSCYFNLSGSAGGSRMLFQQGMYGWTFRYNTLMCGGRLLDAVDVKQKNLIDHNTLVGEPYLGMVSFDKEPAVPGFGDTMTFTNNILYSIIPGIPGDLNTNNCAFYAHSGAFDSAGVSRLVSDHNLFAYYGYRFDPGDRSHRWDQGNYSSTGEDGQWAQSFGDDQHSLYGSPRFADSTVGLNFDAHLLPDSPARAMGTGGSDIGAVAYVATVGVSDPVPRGPGVLEMSASPNPLRHAMTIRFNLPESVPTELEAFDLAGRSARRLLRGVLRAGPHEIHWDGQTSAGADIAPGIYFLRLRAGGLAATRRIAVLR